MLFIFSAIRGFRSPVFMVNPCINPALVAPIACIQCYPISTPAMASVLVLILVTVLLRFLRSLWNQVLTLGKTTIHKTITGMIKGKL